MNNRPDRPAKLFDQKRLITPHLIVNAEVTDGGVLRPRSGYKSQGVLTDLHSLAGDEAGLGVMLGVSQGVLYQLEGETAIPLGNIPGPEAPMTYCQVGNIIYLSNVYWNGSLDLNYMTLHTWGVTLPPAPTVSLTSGGLPPGKDLVCYTRMDNGRLSGAGPLTQVYFQGQAQGIALGNLDDDMAAWITHPDGDQLFLAAVNSQGAITAQAPQFKPITSLNIIPPPCFSHFGFGFGRFWGIRGKELYYSEPNEYQDFGWFSRKSIHFLEDLLMVVPVNEGVFINSATSTWFLSGGDPAKMISHRIGDGAIAGTLTWAQVPGAMTALDGLLRPKGPRMPLPVWMNSNGFITGTQGGTLTHMTTDRLRISAYSQGAGCYRVKDGIPRVLISLFGIPMGNMDDEIGTVNRGGKLLKQYNYLTQGSVLLGSNFSLN